MEDMIYIVAQCIGGLGIVSFIMMYWFRTMKQVRLVKLCMDVFWGVHYLLLGATAGAVANAVCFVREIVFIGSDKRALKSKMWLFIFVGINVITAIVTWKGLYSILPAIVSVFGTYGFWQKNIKTARRIAGVCNVLMFTYDLFIRSYVGMVGESLAFISVILILCKQQIRDKENIRKPNEVKGRV